PIRSRWRRWPRPTRPWASRRRSFFMSCPPRVAWARPVRWRACMACWKAAARDLARCLPCSAVRAMACGRGSSGVWPEQCRGPAIVARERGPRSGRLGDNAAMSSHGTPPPAAPDPDPTPAPVSGQGPGFLARAFSALPRAAIGNVVAKLLIIGLGLFITVLVARQGPRVQGAFALFVAAESALLTLFSGFGLWLARQVSRQAVGPRSPLLPMLLGVLRAAVALGLLASL